MKYEPLTSREEEIGRNIIDSAYRVHKKLGPGLLESVYEACFCYELTRHRLSYERQVHVRIKYEELQFDAELRLDVLVEDSVICELKSVEAMIPLHSAQLLSYLRLTGNRLGYLINFNVPLIKNGIKRMIL